jgi:hypothetical protein
MLSPNHLIDSIPAAVFGLLVLWANGSTCHWFIRTAVALLVVAAPLMIPFAESVVIEALVEALAISAALTIWRLWRGTQRPGGGWLSMSYKLEPRVSLKGLMLFTVVAAMSAFVVVNLRLQNYNYSEWTHFICSGLVAASLVLMGTWLVIGRAHWAVRFLTVIPLSIAMPWLEVILEASVRWVVEGTSGPFWQRVLPLLRWHWTAPRIPTIALCVGVVAAGVSLMVIAGWFTPFSVGVSPPEPLLLNGHARRTRLLARATVGVVTVLIGIVSAYLLFMLRTPLPYPAEIRTEGYREIVAAGQMLLDEGLDWPDKWYEMSDAELRRAIKEFEPALRRVHSALREDCQFPFTDPSSEERDSEIAALERLGNVMNRLCGVDRAGDAMLPNERLFVSLDLLRLDDCESRGNGVDTSSCSCFHSDDVVRTVAADSLDLDALQCKALAEKLWQFEAESDPLEDRVHRERIIDENFWGWGSQLHWVIGDWLGCDRYPDERRDDLIRRIELRLLLAELAIRAFELEKGHPPANLSELVPDYLPAIPRDPVGQGGLKYRLTGDNYEIYSVGFDGEDDGGRPSRNEAFEEIGDLSYTELFEMGIGTFAWYDEPALANADELPKDAKDNTDKSSQ